DTRLGIGIAGKSQTRSRSPSARPAKTAPVRGSRHELRHALRPSAAYSRRIEPALLPDQPGEEIGRQIVLRCRPSKRAADGIGRYRLRWRLAPFGRAHLVRFRCTRLLFQAHSTEE